ncbi:hypothetical protein VNI00_001550 [Paramarasmius palmivorus]|uniref:Uncharacterized protein n=1 Tax=Paramarasmius palmivorus TaxID=297713 RepID=A0AAW0E4I6_9AGAR
MRNVKKAKQESFQKRIVALDFTDCQWGTGPVFDWYKELSQHGLSRSINRLEVRLDKSSLVPHRFVVLYMMDNAVHRVDRRPQERSIDVLKNNAVPTKDEFEQGLDEGDVADIQKTTECEIELFLDGKVDLEVVLSACFSISKDGRANEYTFLEHNCFFFSWTILTVTSRYYLPYDRLESNTLVDRIKPRLPELTSFIVDEAANLLINIVVNTVIIFREKAGKAVLRGMSFTARILGRLPAGVLEFILRRMFEARLHLGLRNQLTKKVGEILTEKAVEITQGALQHHNVPQLLARRLWLNEIDNFIRSALQMEITGVLWSAIFDALCVGFGEVKTEDLIEAVKKRKSKIFQGSRPVQFFAVWNAALNGGLRSAREKTREKETNIRQEREKEISSALEDDDDNPDERLKRLAKSDEDARRDLNKAMFDLAWDAAGKGAKVEAQKLVEETKDTIGAKHQGERAKMWKIVWDVWDDTFHETQKRVRTMSIETLEKVMDKILTIGSDIVLKELSDVKAESHSLNARLLNRPEKERMNNKTIQELMQDTMRRNTFSSAILENINGTMSRIWVQVHKNLQNRVEQALENVMETI